MEISKSKTIKIFFNENFLEMKWKKLKGIYLTYNFFIQFKKKFQIKYLPKVNENIYFKLFITFLNIKK